MNDEPDSFFEYVFMCALSVLAVTSWVIKILNQTTALVTANTDKAHINTYSKNTI